MIGREFRIAAPGGMFEDKLARGAGESRQQLDQIALHDTLVGQSDPELAPVRPQRHGQPYPIWFLKCFCNFLKEHYPVPSKATEVPLLPPRPAVNPFGPPTPPASSPPTGDNVMPFQSDRPHAGPERPRKERPQPTPENPFHEPGEVQPDSVEIKFYPG